VGISLCAFGVVVTVSVWPRKILYVPFFQVMVHRGSSFLSVNVHSQSTWSVEVNSCLAALNMRSYLLQDQVQVVTAPTSVSLVNFRNSLRARMSKVRNQRPHRAPICSKLKTLQTRQTPDHSMSIDMDVLRTPAGSEMHVVSKVVSYLPRVCTEADTIAATARDSLAVVVVRTGCSVSLAS
jgi:hypothetical protein